MQEYTQRTFVAKLPDKAGAFLAADRIIMGEHCNITRVSYNKAVDTHTMFLDISGTEEQLDRVESGLSSLGYIRNDEGTPQVLLLSFLLRDEPGSLMPVLELVHRYDFNISYVNSQSNGSPYQDFKMGLFVEDPEKITAFIGEASEICEVRALKYDAGERTLDNTVFYLGFANSLASKLNLSRNEANEIMTQSNKIMQRLDTADGSPHKTFDFISKWADMLASYRGEKFLPKIDRIKYDGFEAWCIQPPCGSNTYILRKENKLLFVDCGFGLYEQEMLSFFRRIFPDFDNMERSVIVTHPDMDHCGLLDLFDTVYVSPLTYVHFERQNMGLPTPREENPNHAPYCHISRIISRYKPPRMESLRVVGEGPEDPDKAICYLGTVDFCGRILYIYRGNGGHCVGEVIIADETAKTVFTGDITVDADGFTKPQAEFNKLAPYLMVSVNSDSKKASAERNMLYKMFSRTEYRYCCGHGAVMEPEK